MTDIPSNRSTFGDGTPNAGSGGVDLRIISPMEAVAALYSTDEEALADAILSSLSQVVFGAGAPKPASLPQRVMARLSYRLLKRTTVREKVGSEGDSIKLRNRLLERSQHPYAKSLLASSSKETEALVEGGDPMNGPYMMIVPEIRASAVLWDKLFFNSVQGKDVQLRFILETKATYLEAKARLDKGMNIRIKALAAGTGLSLILAYDQLIRDGYDSERIFARITDRDESNTAKSSRLLGKLAVKRGWRLVGGEEPGIGAETEDIFHEAALGVDKGNPFDVVTAVGILEYLQGSTCETTEQRHEIEEMEEPATALHLVARLCDMTRRDGSLIVNTYRPHSSTRILELFGKRFDYRHVMNMNALLSGTQFSIPILVGSGHIYDVKIYKKEIQ